MTEPAGPSPTSSLSTSPPTAMTTPQQSQSPPILIDDNNNNDNNDDDDIWASDENNNNNHHQHNINNERIHSDLPTIRRQHMNSGYLEGLTAGKAKVLQEGFDAGYPIGVKLALRAGVVIGVIEGILACIKPEEPSHRSDGNGGNGGIVELKRLYEDAKRELACSNLLAGVDDRVVADANVQEGLDGARAVIEKWEGIVLGGFAAGGGSSSSSASTSLVALS